jgi:hypothetical protein
MTQSFHGKSRCEHCLAQADYEDTLNIFGNKHVVVWISEEEKKGFPRHLCSMICRWYDYRFIVFSSRWSLVNYSLSGDIMDANFRCYIAAI